MHEDDEVERWLSLFDRIFIRIVKLVGLIIGSGIMVYETLDDHTDRPYLYAAALMMMGLQIAEVIDKVATGLGGRSSRSREPREPREVEQKRDKSEGGS